MDKAILKIKKSISARSGGDISIPDTVVCIPFVQQDSIFVNGYVLSNLSNTITINYTLAQDYKAYPFTSAPGKPGANDFTALIARLNHEVFGYSSFIVNNKKLFKSEYDSATNAVKTISLSDSSIHPNGLLVSYTSCEMITITVCTGAGYARMVIPCWSHSQENCWETVFDDGTGGGGTGTGGTGGGTGGTGTAPDPTIPISGGNPVPHHFPCITGSCPPPATGVPITPIPDDPLPNKTPCQVMDSLMTTNNFPLYYKTLRDSVTVNHEKGYLFKNPFSTGTTFEEVNGTPGTLSINMNPAQQIDGAVHNHYNDSLRLSVYSYEDFYKMYQWFRNNKIADIKTFTFGMVSDSTAYSLMITNPLAFTNFGDKFLANKSLQDIFQTVFYEGYGINEKKSVSENEKAFLKALEMLNSGISLFKANPAITQFKRITLQNNIVVYYPCN